MMDGDDDEPTRQDIARMQAYLDRQAEQIDRTITFLYGPLPNWFPRPALDRAKRIATKLLNDFTPEQIAEFVDAEMKDSLNPPGIVDDALSFFHDINELAHYRYAVSHGELKGLELLGGGDAVSGYKSRNGHKQREDYLDKVDFQKIAAPLFEANNFIITRTLKESELAPYVRKWPRAVRGWLQEIRPPGAMQKGAPKKM